DRRHALEIYISGTLGDAMLEALKLSDPVAQRLHSGPLRARMEELIRNPTPSPRDILQAAALLQPFLKAHQSGAAFWQRLRIWVSMAALFGLLLSVFGSIISPIVFRGGLLLHSLGFAVVTGEGIQASRLRSLCRALIAWTPAVLFVVTAVQHTGFAPMP